MAWRLLTDCLNDSRSDSHQSGAGSETVVRRAREDRPPCLRDIFRSRRSSSAAFLASSHWTQRGRLHRGQNCREDRGHLVWRRKARLPSGRQKIPRGHHCGARRRCDRTRVAGTKCFSRVWGSDFRCHSWFRTHQ